MGYDFRAKIVYTAHIVRRVLMTVIDPTTVDDKAREEEMTRRLMQHLPVLFLGASYRYPKYSIGGCLLCRNFRRACVARQRGYIEKSQKAHFCLADPESTAQRRDFFGIQTVVKYRKNKRKRVNFNQTYFRTTTGTSAWSWRGSLSPCCSKTSSSDSTPSSRGTRTWCYPSPTAPPPST